MQNSAEYLAAALGVMLSGSRLVPVNTRFTATETRSLFEASGAAAWIADAATEQTMAEAATAVSATKYVIDVSPDRPLAGVPRLGAASG